MIEYAELFKKFDSLPKVQTSPPTFLEIAGYPHYENVCSNILAFFFDTKEQHEFQDLFLRSLLKLVGNFDEEDLSTINVQRESITENGNRLDIVIETENLVIGIENKIWAPLYNNLEDYSHYLHSSFKDKKIIKLVLSLYPISAHQLKNGFQNLTHYDLLERVKQELGVYLTKSNNKYLFQLVDFIETMHNHTKEQSMDQKILTFFKQEKEQIDKFLAEYEEVKRFIHNKVKAVQNAINEKLENEEISLITNRQWIWQKFDLVHDFDLGNGITVAVDSYFEIDGIGIKVWVRRGSGNKLDILNELAVTSFSPKIVDNQLWIQEKDQMDITTPEVEVADRILDVLREIRPNVLENTIQN